MVRRTWAIVCNDALSLLAVGSTSLAIRTQSPKAVTNTMSPEAQAALVKKCCAGRISAVYNFLPDGDYNFGSLLHSISTRGLFGNVPNEQLRDIRTAATRRDQASETLAVYTHALLVEAVYC